MAESIVVTAFVRSKSGKEQEVADRLQSLVQASRLDPGIITYDLHHSNEDPAVWLLYEHYQSQEYLNKHLENPVLRSFLADAATFVEGSVDIRKFKMVSEPANAQREEANYR
jgi:quinol monooxygenase YgiN